MTKRRRVAVPVERCRGGSEEKAMSETKDAPHGFCVCAGGALWGCCQGRGPAAFEVERDGTKERLCTRCVLVTDKASRVLLVKAGEDLTPFERHDALGAAVIEGLLEFGDGEAA